MQGLIPQCSCAPSGHAPPPPPQQQQNQIKRAKTRLPVLYIYTEFTPCSSQISRIIIQSKTPLWQTGDLRLTRIKDELRGEILIFKEAEWQTLRIEANALDTGDPTLATTPLRLIANQSKTRITIKKRLNG